MTDDNALRRPARLSLDCLDGRLTILEYGAVWHDEAPRVSSPLPISGRVLYAHPIGRAIGFRVDHIHNLGEEELEVADIWQPPHFDVPALALSNASIGEVVVAARRHYLPMEISVDEHHRLAALEASFHGHADDAELHWRRALEAGDLRAHLRLGQLHLARGDDEQASVHLRFFACLDPSYPVVRLLSRHT